MSLNVSGYVFEGPYTTTGHLLDKSGVYLIVCQNNGKYYPVDVGESATVKSRVEDHERKGCWERNCSSTLAVAVLYTPHLQQAGRQEVEQKIRNQFAFPCGVR